MAPMLTARKNSIAWKVTPEKVGTSRRRPTSKAVDCLRLGMGILNWLKRRRPVELDEDDFQEEIRAHLAIAAKEKVSDGLDPDRRALRGAEGIRQRHADDRSGPQRVDPALARGVARSHERRPLRDPLAREEPGLLAHRHRRADARHRPERRGLHDAQEHGARAARRCRQFQPARRCVARDDGAASASPVVPGLPAPARSRPGVHGSLRLRDIAGRSGSGQADALAVGRDRHRQLLPGPRRSRAGRADAAALGRDLARRSSRRRHQRRPVAARLRRGSRDCRPDNHRQQRAADRSSASPTRRFTERS